MSSLRIHYDRVYTLMDKDITNVNKTNNHLSSQTIEHIEDQDIR